MSQVCCKIYNQMRFKVESVINFHLDYEFIYEKD